MVSNHRDLLGKLIDKPELVNALTGDQKPSDPALGAYLSMFFNHGLNTFILHELGYIDEEWWQAMVRDMRNTLKRKAPTQWWAEVKLFYPERYQQFVEREILKSPPTKSAGGGTTGCN